MGDCLNELWWNHTIEYTESREEWGSSLCSDMERSPGYAINWKKKNKQRMNIMLTLKYEILL